VDRSFFILSMVSFLLASGCVPVVRGTLPVREPGAIGNAAFLPHAGLAVWITSDGVVQEVHVERRQARRVAFSSRVVQMASTSSDVCVLLMTGAVHCWGVPDARNGTPPCPWHGIDPSLVGSGLVSIVATGGNYYGIDESGQVTNWANAPTSQAPTDCLPHQLGFVGARILGQRGGPFCWANALGDVSCDDASGSLLSGDDIVALPRSGYAVFRSGDMYVVRHCPRGENCNEHTFPGSLSWLTDQLFVEAPARGSSCPGLYGFRRDPFAFEYYDFDGVSFSHLLFSEDGELTDVCERSGNNDCSISDSCVYEMYPDAATQP
jgi:hypothetical protein